MSNLKKEAYLTQIFAYLSNQDYEKAHEFSREFVDAYPKEMISHLILAKSAFRLKNYEIAAEQARLAFNLAESYDDMATCAVLASTAYYQTEEFEKGYELLEQMKKIKNTEEIEKMMFILSMALKKHAKAMEHLDELTKFNKKTAKDLILAYLYQTENS